MTCLAAPSPATSHPLSASTPSISATAARRLSPGGSFALLASITISFLAGSSAPTPLYPVYQAQWGFSPITTAIIFGIYAVVLLAALLIAGRLSDHIGRRPVLVTAALVQVVAMAVFSQADGVAGLVLARIIQGIATGGAVAAIGAGMMDLNAARGTLANSVAPALGTATGAIVGGVLVHFLPAPTHLVYWVLALVYLAQALGIAFMPETNQPRAGAWSSLKPQFRIPASVRSPLLVATPILIAAWSLAGLYAALVPGVLRTVFGWNASLLGGIALFLLAGSGALAVLLLRQRAAREMLVVGATGVLLGAGMVVGALTYASAAGFVLGTLVAGAGFGLGFQGGMRTVMPLAAPQDRAGVLSVIFVVSYLAMGVPAIIAGFFAVHTGNLLATANGFGLVIVALAALALVGAGLTAYAGQRRM